MSLVDSRNCLDWDEVQNNAKNINDFIQSLNEKSFNSSSKFDNAKFAFIPSKQSDSFLEIQNAFSNLRKKVDELRSVISSLTFHEDQRQNFNNIKAIHRNLLLSVVTIDLIAQPAIERVIGHYKANRDIAKASSLLQFAKDIMPKICEEEQLLLELLKKFDENYQKNADAIRFGYSAWPLLISRNKKRQNLLDVTWSEQEGVIIKEPLALDCLEDQELKNLSRPAIRNAANFLEIPQEAEEIGIQFGEKQARWIPLRPVTDRTDRVIIEKGVTGTCERDAVPQGSIKDISKENICNFYFCINPFDEQLTISCGAINTERKAIQFVQCLKKIKQEHKDSSQAFDRFVLLQLNSFNGERDLIENTNKMISIIENEFKKETSADASFLHMNTSFNATSSLPNEDKSSFSINIKALFKIVQFAVQDIEQIISNFNGKEAIEETEQENEAKQENALHQLKNWLRQMDGKDFFSNSSSSHADEGCPNTIISLISDVINELDALVKKENENMDIASLLSRAMIMMESLKINIGLQLKLDNFHSFSRCTEIEFLLLTFKMLKINPIIVCKSGLDRSGAVRAISLALSHLEMRFDKQEDEDKSPPLVSDVADLIKVESDSKGKDIEVLFKYDYSKSSIQKRTNIYAQLYAFIFSHSVKQAEIFEKYNEILKGSWFARSPGGYIEDLDHVDQIDTTCIDQAVNPRQRLLEEIKSSSFAKESLYYNELILYYLFRELIKTLNSTGVIGLKYHQDREGLGGLMANYHPIQRLPMVVNLQKNNEAIIRIRLLNLTTTWNSTVWNWTFGLVWERARIDFEVTKAAQQLLLRLSQKRGN